MTRREEREQAFALIFEKSFRDDSVEDIIGDAKTAEAYSDSEFSEKTFFGVYENLSEIDGVISENLHDWTIDRISKVALSILRLALYEIKYMDDIPQGVSINEAVELAKKYSTVEDAAYINGILGSVVKAKQ